MKIKKLTAYLLMSGMILGTMSSDLYTIKAQAVETIEETEDKTPENETPQVPETPEPPETEPENGRRSVRYRTLPPGHGIYRKSLYRCFPVRFSGSCEFSAASFLPWKRI